jgi:alkyl hydroperoxide reductase subunit AhpF
MNTQRAVKLVPGRIAEVHTATGAVLKAKTVILSTGARWREINVPGVFAAGDVTTVPYKQIVIAVGAGATAALSAFDHLIRSGDDEVEAEQAKIAAAA